MLNIRHDLPANFLTVEPRHLHDCLCGPTLIHLPGKRKAPVLVSILLHGNEIVGLKAIQDVLLKYQHKPLPRELMLFVGNIEAAKHGLRKMPDGDDFNRVWPGTDHGSSDVGDCMRQVVEYARRCQVFVSLDLHNNTGTNPHYSCISRVDAKTLQLALLFARTVVFFRRPLGVQSVALSEICPALTCECGKIGDAMGVQRAAELIDACLHMTDLPSHLPPKSDYHLLRTVATLRVAPTSSIAFGEGSQNADLFFSEKLDHLNFRPLPEKTVIGYRRPGSESGLEVVDEQGLNVESSFLVMQDDAIVLRRSIIPSMLTTNIQVIRDDCLGYFMEEFEFTGGDSATTPAST